MNFTGVRCAINFNSQRIYRIVHLNICKLICVCISPFDDRDGRWKVILFDKKVVFVNNLKAFDFQNNTL